MRLAACLYVRDEAHDIAEWLAFHHVVGVDHILVFDNGSRDGTQAIVRQAARFASIRLLPWPVRDRRAQVLAYALGLRLLRGFDWVAFLDADELLTPTGDRGVKAVLNDLPDADAVAVNWAVIGSGGHAETPPGRMLESYVRRAPDDFAEHRIVKSIVRPRRARALNPHQFTVQGAYASPSGAPVTWQQGGVTADAPDFTRLQMNHYFTRSRAHWARKIARGYRDIAPRSPSDFDHYDRNEVEDRSAARLSPAVRAELARRGQLRRE